MKFLILIFLFCILHGSTLAYRAAVFEHYPRTSDTPLNTILTNINDYRGYANTAKSQSADILVFPEYGLTTIVSDPEGYAIEVEETNSVIKELAALALERQIYLVVNLLEKVQDSNKATKYYNTNLVFGRNGTIILKYRKINLYDEPKLTPGDADQTVTFTTDFGVTFGIFTCFDILFENPAKRVLENDDVTDIVYPTAWYSTMPFFTSLSVQHGYALANGVNLLAANYAKPKEGHGGSGIYIADGKTADLYIGDTASSKPIVNSVGRIPKRLDKSQCSTITPFGLPGDLTRNNVSNYVTQKNFDASNYEFKSVDLNQQTSNINICQGDFCCTFDIVVDPSSVSSSDIYKVVAFDGIVKIDDKNHQLRVCSLLACETESDDSCGNRLNSTNTKFTKLTVQGNLKSNDGMSYTPTTVDSYLLPIRNTDFCNNKNGTDSTFVKLSTLTAQQDVLAFGLVGRTSSAGSIYGFGFLVVTVLAIVKNVVF